MSTPRQARPLLVAGFLGLVLAACGGAVSGPTGLGTEPGDELSSGLAAAPTPVAQSLATEAEPEADTSSAADCADLADAAAGIQLWVTSVQAVTSDAQWQQLVANVQFDVSAFRQRAELVAALPDAASPRVDPWSSDAGSLQDLVRLAADAVATNTPFADGIGSRMVELAGGLSVGGMMALQDSLAAAGC